MCLFYHASDLKFKQGQEYSINDFDGDTTHDHYRRPETEKLINIQLDKARPEGVLSRIKCICLFSNLELCKEFARNAGFDHIYSVCPSDEVYGPYPMTLVTTLFKCQETIRGDVIKEYWNHTREWNVYEYLTSSILVTEEVRFEKKGRSLVGFEAFVKDIEQSKRLFTSSLYKSNNDDR